MKLYFLFFFFLPSILFSEVTERFSKNKANINEQVEYILSWDESLDIQWDLPKKGIGLKEKLPLFEIQKIDEFENEIRILVRFFNSGFLDIPITYTLNGEIKTTNEKIEIVSNLTGTEQEIEPIEPPVEVRGNIWPRLILFLVIGLALAALVFYIVYFIFNFIKKRKIQKKELEVIIDSLAKFRLQREEYRRRMNDLLSKDPIESKSLIFLLSDLLKAEVSYLFKKDFFHLTEKELFDFLSSEYKLSQEVKSKWYPIFLKQKYCDIQLRFTKQEAKIYIEDWNKILNL